MATHTLTIEIEYDDKAASPGEVSDAVDRMLETSMSTEGILDEVGNPSIGPACIDSHEMIVAARKYANLVRVYLAGDYEHSDSTYMGERESFLDELHRAILRKHNG